MEELFEAEFFINNRRRLKTLFQGTAPIVLTANGLLQRSGDTVYPFRQDTNFWYLTGLVEPDLILVMDKDKEYLIVPNREASREAFDGAIEDEALTKRSGIRTILDEKSGWKQLNSRLQRAKHAATISAAPAYIEQYGMYTNPARMHLIETIKKTNPDIELLDLRPHFIKLRTIKQDVELQAIERAIAATSKTLKGLRTRLPKFEHEYEAEAFITRSFRLQGTNGHGFEPIVAGGKNACTIHSIANNDPLNPGELLVVDVGAEVEYYSADITRTFAAQEPTKRQQQVYDAVLEVQDYAFGLLKPGVLIKEYEAQVEQFMGEKLRSLGLIKSIEHDQVRRYYPHATTHHLGLDVHDIADYTQPLEPGMVLTVEPGIYIPEESIGIRIEDDVVVTADGIKVLSSALPRTLH